MNESISCPVTEASQVGAARRLAIGMAEQIGLEQTETGKVALVVTELASNLVKHARDGELLFQTLERHGVAGVEVLSLDKAPGIDVDRCRRDGYSTAGTPGTGLGAIVRSSTFFDSYTSTAGNVLQCQIWPKNAVPQRQSGEFDIGGVARPVAGESVSGDAWGCHEASERSLFLMADGLGHGPLAADAAREALRIFHAKSDREPAAIIHAIHAALRSTRGAAVAVAEAKWKDQTLQFAGVGNISATIVSAAGSRSLMSSNGIVGHQLHKVQEFTYELQTDALFIMHSDGLTPHWKLDLYPGLIRRAPVLIAAVLYRDFKRERDDASVLVARGSHAFEEAA